MTFSWSQLARAILWFFAHGFRGETLDASAQETAGGPATGDAYPNNNAAAFTDPLNEPHWNGWASSRAQDRFQPEWPVWRIPSLAGTYRECLLRVDSDPTFFEPGTSP